MRVHVPFLMTDWSRMLVPLVSSMVCEKQNKQLESVFSFIMAYKPKIKDKKNIKSLNKEEQ